MEDRELLPIVESLLFMSGEPITIERLQEILEGITKGRILNTLSALRNQYDQNGHGLQLVEVAGGYQLATRPECSPWIKRLEKVKSGLRLSKPALETLAIIAYKQPVIRAEIEQIRGVDSMGVIKTLLERHLIKINGRRDAMGRPIVYGTTKDFLMNFGLKSLSELPTLRDFQEVARSEGEGGEENGSREENGNGKHTSLDDLESKNEGTQDSPEELKLEAHVPN